MYAFTTALEVKLIKRGNRGARPGARAQGPFLAYYGSVDALGLHQHRGGLDRGGLGEVLAGGCF